MDNIKFRLPNVPNLPEATPYRVQANSNTSDLESYFPSSSPPTSQLLQYVRELPPHQEQSIFDILQQDPEVKESRYILPYKSPPPLAKGCCNKPNPWSSRDVAPFFKQCYESICAGKVDEKLFEDVTGVILDRVYEAYHLTKVEEVKQAMERTLALASRLVKGETCEICGPGYDSANPGSGYLHYGNADVIRCLEEVLTDLNLTVELSNKGRYSLQKLVLIVPNITRLPTSLRVGGKGWSRRLERTVG